MRLNLKSIAQPTSLNNQFRFSRFALFRKLVERTLARDGECRILDIGGLPDYWSVYGADLLGDRRISISIVNLSFPEEVVPSDLSDGIERIIGDARTLAGVPDKSFHLAHSNSVIEHVGRWADMCAMAAQVRRVARAHYVQTPYWGFPLDPHNRTPLFQWMPEQWRYRLVLSRDLGFWKRASNVDEAMRLVQSNYLLDRRQFGALFPTSSIYSEIVYGLTKSLIAIGGDGLEVDPRSNTRRLRV